MPKNPILPLYYNDITSSTKSWTDEEFGAYMRLLIEQWDKGSIPDDQTRIKRIAPSAKKHWKLLKEKFVKDENGLLKNLRMEEIREHRNFFLQKQSENGRKGGAKPKPNVTQTITQTEAKQQAKTKPSISERDSPEDEKEIDAIVFFNVEEIVLKNQIQFERICMSAGKDAKTGRSSLHKYHLYLEEKEQYPKGKKALFAGFEKWLLNEKKKPYEAPEYQQPSESHRTPTI